MRSSTSSILAAGLSAVVLLGAVSMTAAAPGQKGKKPAKPAKGAHAAAAGNAAAGSKVYMANGCSACHAIGDKGGKTGPALTKIGADKKWTAAKLTTAVRDPKKLDHDAKMPAYGPDKINDKELKNLVAYLQSLKK
jgi:mono/diheme cytochrome c family protein